MAAGRAPGLAPFGTGNPGYSIKEEFTTNPNNSHEDGALAMARSMDPNSAGSQFYLCLGPQHNLDSGYTVFGQTIEGKDVIGQLRAGDVIESVVIENAAEVVAPAPGSTPAVRAVSPRQPRPAGRPECLVKEVYEQRVIRSSKCSATACGTTAAR